MANISVSRVDTGVYSDRFVISAGSQLVHPDSLMHAVCGRVDETIWCFGSVLKMALCGVLRCQQLGIGIGFEMCQLTH